MYQLNKAVRSDFIFSFRNNPIKHQELKDALDLGHVCLEPKSKQKITKKNQQALDLSFRRCMGLKLPKKQNEEIFDELEKFFHE